MDQPKRKHRATGRKPPGGKRPGAGRPPGPNTLEYGEVRALSAMRLRVPEGASPEVVKLADATLGRMIDVMYEKTSAFQAGHVLKSATRIREELLTPLAQKHEVAGKDGGALVVNVVEFTGDDDA